MKAIFILFLSLSAILCFAQKQDPADAHPWGIKQIVYLSDSTGAGDLYFKDNKSAGIAFVDQNGNVSKELTVPGRVVGLARWKGNLVAIYVDQWDPWKLIKEVHGMIVDGRTKNILSDQLVYSNTGRNFIECTMANDDQGNFGCLLIRSTGVEGNFDPNFPKQVRHLGETTAFNAITLTDASKPVAKPLTSTAVGAAYLAAYANHKGEVAILSFANGQVTAEKFGRDGQLQKKLTGSLPDYTPNSHDDDHGLCGTFNPRADDILAFSMANPDVRKGHRNLNSFVFDFAAGKTTVVESFKADKDYLAQIKFDPSVSNTRNFKNPEDFRPDGILFAGDTLIISKEIRYNELDGNNVRFASAGTIISMYDRQYHPLHQFTLDKYFEAFSNGGRGWTYRLHDGKLLAFTNVITGAEHYDNICYVIDMKTFRTNLKVLDWGNGGRRDYSNVEDIFWFRDNLLKDQALSSFMYRHVNSYLVKMAYP
jgi:hypothetical protein